MIKKHHSFLLTFLPLYSWSQVLTSSAAQSGAIGQIHFAYALGEPIIGTIGNKPVVTQGFLQPSRLQITSLNDSKLLEPAIQVYPNPTQDKVVIANVPACRIQLTNVQGQTVYEAEYKGPFSVSSFSAGQYLLQIHDLQGEKLHSSSLLKY